jgi:2-polyprenyl-6-hydroxyphenyl methylase/3-demethylubiquinone-9 3-methyltransferase
MAGVQEHPASVRADEIERFGRLADRWWDPAGPMRPLHAMNPLRVGWIDQRIRAAHGEAGRLLDIGCGAGIAAEALARLGCDVLGIDASAEAVAAAQEHADGAGLPLEYRAAAAEDLVAEGARFPVITAEFLLLMARLLAPGGLLFVSTLNRTPQSLLVAKLGAEYLLRLLPVGTHDWARFVTPMELAEFARGAGLRMTATSGMSFSLRTRDWVASRDLSINYIAMLQAPDQARGA